ncbi:MAG: putative photosystem II stability/assembly factor-like protein [Bacteroidetes bacterium]|nr:MAG: putative photosystem II stability/assembly factor-like protein [Bacteroidota bacterium]
MHYKRIFLLVILFVSNHFLHAQTWESLNSGTDYILFDLSFPPGQNTVGYAAGMQYTWDAEGIVIKTVDGGDTWTTVLNSINQDGIEAICFTSPDTGFIAGWNDYFARTTDGGQIWNDMVVGNDNWFFLDLEFYDSLHGVALATLNSGGAVFYITNDGGNSWSASSTIDQMLFDVCYANSTTLYAVGSNEKVMRSVDGGYNWNDVYSGSQGGFLLGIDFKGDFGVAGGEDGKILFTTDGANNWSSYTTGYHYFEGVHVFNSDSAYIGGTDEDVYKTVNGGDSWVVEDNGAGDSHIYKVKFTDNNTGFLCGSQGMLKRKAGSATLIADFIADQTTVCTTQPVQFSNLSTGQVDSYEWHFEGGDPEFSTEANPLIYFHNQGVYDVSLTIHSDQQQNSLVKENYIESLLCEGIEENNGKYFLVYPNPASKNITIQGLQEEIAHVKILDPLGNLKLENNFTGNILNVSQLKKGIYFISISSKDKEQTQKLVIE